MSYIKLSVKPFTVVLALTLCSFLSTASASTVSFPSGEQVELNRKQMERIKMQPGVFHIQYPSENIIPNNLTDRAIVQVPADLGGGFLVGLAQNLDNALDTVLEDDPADRSEQKLPEPQATEAHANPTARLDPTLSLTAGHRSDSLDWNIAADFNGSTPNVLSELTWEDLEILQIKAAIETAIGGKFFFKGHLGYGWIYDGSNQDSDYLGDNRTMEFSRSNNSADDGDVWDWSIAIGPRFTFAGGSFEMMPLIGYSYHEQNLVITDGFQTVPALGSFPDLDSSYDTQWYGPWVGLDLLVNAGQPLGVFTDVDVFGSVEYHWADYYAEANWNLITRFAHPKSFEHEADGQGYTVTLGTRLYFNAQWALSLAYSLAQWDTDAGIDRVFFSDGEVASTRLNEVNWRSDTFSLGLAYRF